jgi:hypothetical protein
MDLDVLKKHVIIVKSRLDDELEIQAAHMLNCTDELAMAVAKRDNLKEMLSRVDSEIAAELRSDEEKISEAKIVTLIPMDERHIKAFRAYIDAKLIADRWFGMQEVFRQRGSMLKVLVDLYLSGYYSKDGAEGGLGKVRDVQAADGRSAMSAARKLISRR